MIDLLVRPTFWAPSLALLSYFVYRLSIIPANLPKGLAVVGAKNGDWFPLLQASWRNTKDFKATLRSAYSLYKDRAAIFPTLDSGTQVLLPPGDIKFMAEQPTDVLSMHESVINLLQTDYTVMDPSLIHEPLHQDLVPDVLTKEIGNLIAPVRDEMEHCFQQIWGSPAAYHEVEVLKTMQQIISGVTNRVFVGLPLCRNQEVLDLGVAFAQDIPLSSAVLRLFPSFLRPVVAPLITLPNRWHTNKFIALLGPEIDRRIAKYDSKSSDDQEPNDCLQWAIAQAKRTGKPKHWTKAALAQRILLLNFAAIHTSSFAIAHALLDLAASPPETIETLRQEIHDVMAQHNGVWSKIALAQLKKLDSVMRESQRKNSFVVTAVNRKVVAQDGVTFPSGTHVARGVTVVSSGYSIHQDPDIYPNPDKFDPFRFEREQQTDNENDAAAASEQRKAFTSTSKTFLAWGLGKNACPGRFFASNEIKCLLAHILLHYDIEPLDARPHNTWIASNRIPPTDAKIRIKKRVE